MGGSRGRFSIGALAVLATLVLGGSSSPAGASELVDIPMPARNGELPPEWVVRYPNDDGPRAKVLLPDDYDPDKAYPLLVLLIGLSSHYSDWSDRGEGEIAKTAAGFPGIIVMPEGGDGWYADWWNGGKRGAPSWESYILDQVIPQIHERYRIRKGRRWHALAGVSMGGLGTAYLGGRLPGYFGSIAAFSGFVDTQLLPAGIGLFQSAAAYAGAGLPPGNPFIVTGPPGGFYETGHNPARLAQNLTHTRVFMATGDGTPLVQDPDIQIFGLGIVGQSAELVVIRPMSDSYAAALRDAGVDLTYVVQPGNHDWFNFRKELRQAIEWGLFEPVATRPLAWVNDTVAARGNLWQVGYKFDAPPDRLVRFQRRGDLLEVGAAGSPVTLTLPHGCRLHVETPATVSLRACPRATVKLKRLGSDEAAMKLRVRAGGEKIRKVNLRLPGKLSFAKGKRLERGLVAKAGGHNLDGGKVRHGRRALSLRSRPVRRFTATVFDGALLAKPGLRSNARLRVAIRVTDATGERTKLHVRSS